MWRWGTPQQAKPKDEKKDEVHNKHAIFQKKADVEMACAQQEAKNTSSLTEEDMNNSNVTRGMKYMVYSDVAMADEEGNNAVVA